MQNDERRDGFSEDTTITRVRDVKSIAKDIKVLVRDKFRRMSSGPEKRSVWKDFCSFKIMLFPQIVKALWILGVVVSTLVSISRMAYGFSNGSWGFVGVGFLILILSPLMTHLILEFILLPFSILEILREIRDQEK